MKYEASTVVLPAPPDAVFAFVDDHERLSSHMNQSSWMMGGGRMRTEMDAQRGQATGSHIRLAGRVFGITLSLDEVVTVREPPARKVWETVGVPKLLVIGAYRMGIEVQPDRAGSSLRVFIEYERPAGRVSRVLAWLFGGTYARWCVKQMTEGARDHFTRRAPSAAA